MDVSTVMTTIEEEFPHVVSSRYGTAWSQAEADRVRQDLRSMHVTTEQANAAVRQLKWEHEKSSIAPRKIVDRVRELVAGKTGAAPLPRGRDILIADLRTADDMCQWPIVMRDEVWARRAAHYVKAADEACEALGLGEGSHGVSVVERLRGQVREAKGNSDGQHSEVGDGHGAANTE